MKTLKSEEGSGSKARISLKRSPYTYVRTVVMRTLLIPKTDYPRLLKMGISEISAYLSETQYRKEINEFGVTLSGIELVEHALFRNFVNAIAKLKRISPKNYNLLIEEYLLHYDIDNVKSIIRGKIAGLSQEEIRRLLIPAGIISEKALDALIKKESIEELISALPSPLNELSKNHKDKELKSKSLREIETALDSIYFKELLLFADRIPRQGKLFKEFIYTMISCNNILTFFRLKKEKMQIKEAEKYIVYTPHDSAFLTHLLHAKSQEEVIEHIKKSGFKNVIPLKAVEPEESLIPLEVSLERYIYEKALHFARQNPMSVYSILSYLFAKEMEIKNIMKIVKAKYLRIEEEKIMPLLVTI